MSEFGAMLKFTVGTRVIVRPSVTDAEWLPRNTVGTVVGTESAYSDAVVSVRFDGSSVTYLCMDTELLFAN